MKNILLLAGGLLLTLLFLIMSATAFEGMYYEREFSNEMYNQGLYLPVSFLVTGMAWGLQRCTITSSIRSISHDGSTGSSCLLPPQHCQQYAYTPIPTAHLLTRDSVSAIN